MDSETRTALVIAILSLILAVITLVYVDNQQDTRLKVKNPTIVNCNGVEYETIQDSNGDVTYIERGD